MGQWSEGKVSLYDHISWMKVNWTLCLVPPLSYIQDGVGLKWPNILFAVSFNQSKSNLLYQLAPGFFRELFNEELLKTNLSLVLVLFNWVEWLCGFPYLADHLKLSTQRLDPDTQMLRFSTGKHKLYRSIITSEEICLQLWKFAQNS